MASVSHASMLLCQIPAHASSAWVTIRHPSLQRKKMTHRKVLLQRRAAEMLVHLEAAVKQLLKVVPADAERNAHADGRPARKHVTCHTSLVISAMRADDRPERVAAANPVPELEHVVDINSKF